MKLEIISKTRLRDHAGAIVTRYGCAILSDNGASAKKEATVQITLVGEDFGSKDIGDQLEVQ